MGRGVGAAGQAVAAFVDQHGRLPHQKGGEAQPLLEVEGQLGEWCYWQRRRRRGTRGAELTSEEVVKLEAIPGWQWGEQPDA